MVDLGETDEEKIINIIKIRKIRDKITKIYGIFYFICYLFLAVGALAGIGISGGIKSFFMITYVLAIMFIFVKYICFNSLAWTIYFFKGDYLKTLQDSANTLNSELSTENLIRTYCISGHHGVNALVLGDLSGEIFVLSIFGFIFCWLGAFNMIIHSIECFNVSRRIKKKYGKIKINIE